MFSILKRGLGVFYSSPARLLRFSLNNALRPYLKDELQQDNFELQLWQGIVNIENLELNETMLNKKLNGSVPFYITHARVGKLSMDIPWRKVATDSVRVDIHDVSISISLSPPSSSPKEEVVEKYMEKCLEKSLEHSQHIIEESEDNDMDENLGIQSVEELFENIFNNMNVAIHNIKIYIEKGQDNAVLSLNVNTMNLMNEPSHGTTIKKMATFEGLSIDIEGPEEMKGNVVKMQEKNSVHFEYEKKENITNVVVFTDLTNGLLNFVLLDNQYHFISHFFENMKSVEKKEETNTTAASMYESVLSNSSDEEDMGKSLYESAIADSDDEHINALSNSILLFAPVQNPHPIVTPSDPMDFTFKLRLRQLNVSLSCKNSQTLKHVIELHDLHFVYHMLESKTSMEVIVEDMNMSEINGDSRLLLLKFLSTNPKVKPQKFKLSFDKTDRQGQIIEDLKIDMPILYIRWDLKSLMNMIKVFQYQGVTENTINKHPIGPPPSIDPKSSPSSLRSSFTIPPIFNLKIPRVQLYLDFASLQSASHSISAIDLEISEVRVRKIPIPENSTRKWFIEFDGFNSWIINSDLVKRSFVSIWTVDLEDKPRLELTTQEPSMFNKPIPSMMMDLETVFSHPLFFSYFAKGTRDMMPYRPNNTIDFDGFILDLVFQNVHVELKKSDFAFVSMVTSQLSGDSASASSTIATIGKVELVLVDDIESSKNPDQSPVEFRGDFEEFRLFQSTFIKENRIGSFLLINNRDAILLNQHDVPLLRKAPRQLRMDQLFCPPLAVTFPEFELCINQDIFLFESVTVGFKVAAWEQFVNFWIPSSTTSEEKKAGKEEEEAPSSTTNVELKITNATIFYQPLEIAERTSATIVIAPPRAVFSVGQFYLKYSTNQGMHFNVKNIKLWLKEDFHYLKNSEIWLDMCHPDIASHLKNKSLVEVLSLEDLDIRYETKDKVSEISLNFLKENMSPDSNPFVLSVRPDSFETLVKIFRALATDFPKEGYLYSHFPVTPRAPLPKPTIPVQKVDFEIVHAKKLGGNIEFVEDYEPHQEEEEEQVPVLTRAIPIPVKQPQKDLSHSFILFDEDIALGTSPDAVIEKKKRSIDPIEESWEWVGRVAPKKPIQQDDTEKIFPSNIPKSMQIKLNNMVVVVRFMGGKDWRNEEFYIHQSFSQYRLNKALESTQDSVDLQFDIPCITFDTFAPEQPSEWRVYLEIRRMLIEDHVKTSHNKNILTFTRHTSSKTSKKTKPSPSIQLWCEQNYKGSYKFKFTVKPMRLYLDQDTASFIGDFFTYSSSSPSSDSDTEDPSEQPTSTLPDSPPLFDYFETSILDMIVDYKPRMTIGQVYNDIRLGNNIWAIKVVELNKVPITLSPIKLNFVKNSSEFKERVLDTWIKDFTQGGVYNIFKGTRIGQPVQICLNIGSGVIDLIKTPVEEYNKGGNVLRGIGVGATSLAQKITVELLNIGASSAITIKKGLTGIDKAITVHPAENLHVSSYANQPENLAEAATQATGNIKNGFSNSLNALYYGGIRNLPSAIIQPAIGTLEALSNLTLGVRNMIDKSEYEKSKEKYKTVLDQQELRKKPS